MNRELLISIFFFGIILFVYISIIPWFCHTQVLAANSNPYLYRNDIMNGYSIYLLIMFINSVAYATAFTPLKLLFSKQNVSDFILSEATYIYLPATVALMSLYYGYRTFLFNFTDLFVNEYHYIVLVSSASIGSHLYRYIGLTFIAQDIEYLIKFASKIAGIPTFNALISDPFSAYFSEVYGMPNI